MLKYDSMPVPHEINLFFQDGTERGFAPDGIGLSRKATGRLKVIEGDGAFLGIHDDLGG